MSETFYRAFEDRYRGSRELITSRLEVYLPFLAQLTALAREQTGVRQEPAPAQEHGPGEPEQQQEQAAQQATQATAQPTARPAALDLGCGRGEWLELLGKHGFAAHGVDLDAGMLAACIERNLDVELTDALGALRARADGSLALVSAFHLVEHIPFDQVQALIAEARRVLQPGGLLIMETPNPENLVVGASSFYMDPSHLRPLPSQLLEFAVSHAGYARAKVLRLQEARQLHTDAAIGLINVLDGVSPDYAVIGQKAAGPALLQRFDAQFATPYGIALPDLAQRYDAQDAAHRAELHGALGRLGRDASEQAEGTRAALDVLRGELAGAAQGAERALRQQERHNAGLMAQQEARTADMLVQLEARIEAGMQSLQAGLAHAEARAQQAEQEAERQRQHIAALLASSSWRVTAPLRGAAHQAYRLRAALREGRVVPGLKRRARPLVLDLARAVLRRPALKRAGRALLDHFPGLQARLRRMLYQAAASAAAAPAAAEAPPPPPANAAALSPRAQRMARELQRAIAARKN